MTKASRTGWIASFLLGVLGMATASSGRGQEFTLYGGRTTAPDLSASTYAWKLEYRQGLGEHFELSYSWLNEGHVTDHHRDGHSLQLWARESVFHRRLSLGIGAGAIRYYDTSPAPTRDGYNDVHGWAGILTVDAALYAGERWTIHAQANRTWASSQSIDTWDFLVGLGYQLTPPDEPGPRPWPESQTAKTTNNEITVFLGRTVVNSFNSEKSVATSLEYRAGLTRYFDVSAAFLYEGDSRVVRRGGFIVQGWFGRAFLDGRLALSLGGGIYVAVDKRAAAPSGDSGGTVAAMVTPSVSYRLGKHWHGRFSWNRTVTTYSKDTDVFQIGLGYRL